MKELDFRLFKYEEEIDSQRELFRESFPETIGTSVESVQHYSWKFQSFPAGNKASFEYGAYFNGNLVGYYAAIPYQYYVGEELMTCGMVCDVMTSPSMRGKGVFVNLGHHSTEDLGTQGVDFTTGYPIRPEVIPGHLKVKWEILFELPIYLKVLKSKALLETKKIGFISPLIDFMISQYHGMLGLLFGSKGLYECKVLTRAEFINIEKYDSFFNSWRKNKKISLRKSQDFIKWRTGAPGSEYRFIVIEDRGEIVAIAIVRRTDLKGIPTLAVLDMMVLDSQSDCLAFLYKKIDEVAREVKAETIAMMISKTWAKGYKLVKGGFVKTPLKFSFILKQLNPSLDRALVNSETNWHLMWIDSDDL